jgi:hypothetical protein
MLDSSRSSACACSSRRATSPSWRPVLAQRRVEQLLLRLPVKLLLAAVAITSDGVGAITSLSPPHGDGRNGRVPWREGHLGLAGRVEGPHARALPCGPWAAGCGCVSSLTSWAARPRRRATRVARRSRGCRGTGGSQLLGDRGAGRGCRSGLGGRWIRAQAPAGPGRIDWNQVTSVSAVVSPSGASWTTAFRNGVVLPAELEPRLVDVERLPAPGRLREPMPTITSWIVIAAPPGLLPIGSGFLLAGYS